MHTYLIMQNPGHSRVYYTESTKLALAELKIACKRFESTCQNIEMLTVADIFYISFTLENPMTRKDLCLLSRLSFIFALFEHIEVNKQWVLVPIAFPSTASIDPKISHLLKYSGKTNELFTKMMVNIGLLSSSFTYDPHIQLLDPIAGKGTTLFEGMVYGFDVAGVEVNKTFVQEACVFFKKFLEKGKYKHNLAKLKDTRKNHSDASVRHVFEYAATKDDFKNESSRRTLTFVHGDTTNTNKYFKKNSFHLIIGDLPYGISHKNKQKYVQYSQSRNPVQLLSDCLPEWYKVLKDNGILVLSWNTFLLSRDNFIHQLRSNNFSVFSEAPYGDFEHRVDMSIKRDILVAKKES
jgi:hypothetical protein